MPSFVPRLAALLLCLAAACDLEDCPCAGEGTCVPAEPGAVPATGTATLLARATYDDYQAATMSFEHATVIDHGEVGNDWDLLFGNDQEDDLDLLTVNTVTDDRSSLCDLGPIRLDQVPPVIDLDACALGAYGAHDDLPARLGHLYLVRTRDGNTRQVAVFRVVAHDLDDSITIDWARSPEPDRFLPPDADR